ncbi:Glycerate dehydrogenase [Pandoraea eparura]|uniref:Glycerate dehydrogenase n=1 Tax=Pandoraea eparura TaxID=2508291 RepID=A0A5E4U5F8_9BURK|nr:D-2-hydroxyacid dehydrogenase [Pandoraea eparura]VVD94833.1 Glycerate dehydrogenase [Pandoraea eparura]
MEEVRPLRVVFLDSDSIAGRINLLQLAFPHDLVVHGHTSPSEVAARVEHADIVITNKVRLDTTAITAATRLKLIAVAATGTDVLDLQACFHRGVQVSNIRNYAACTVPEHTFALIFALRRSLLSYRDAVRAGRWQEVGRFCFFDFPIRDLHGSTIGIIGDGVLGQAVAAIARALGMCVLRSERKGATRLRDGFTPFDEMLSRSEIISLHCPLLPATFNMIGAPEFARMEQKPLLINTARGGLVNELALVEAIKSGVLTGAAFDVATEEPPSPTHPFQELRDYSNFILTPHIAWASEQAIEGLIRQLSENISSFVAGKPRNLVALSR